MKLRWLIFCQSFLLAYAFFWTVAEHKGQAVEQQKNIQAGQSLDVFLGPEVARHFRRNEVQTVYAGLLPQGARQTGHFGVLMEFADHSYLLVHKGANQYADSPLSMLQLIALGMKQRVEILSFKNQQEIRGFAEAIGWRFVKVEVEEPSAVKKAFTQALDRFYTQPDQWVYSLVQENCMMFGMDLIEAGRPLYWSRSYVMSVIPANAFANIVAAHVETSL